LVVTLVWAGVGGTFGTGDEATLTTVTGTDGSYSFGNLPAGNFTVSVDTSGTNLTPTFDLDGAATPNTATTTLTPSQDRTDADFGLIGNASVGDRVWIDQDGDGIQQVAEPGIPGATVVLTSPGFNGILGDADDISLTATTGTNGMYLFTGLPVFGGSDN